MSLLPPEIRPSLTGVNLFTQKHQPLRVNCGGVQTEAAKSFFSSGLLVYPPQVMEDSEQTG